MESNTIFGFLHNHPKKEAELGLDDTHVIVDKEDWVAVRSGGLANENKHLRDSLEKLHNTLHMIVEQMEFDGDTLQ